MIPPEHDNELVSQPHDRAAEEAVIGSVLINPGIIKDLLHVLEPGTFFIVRFQWIWQAMIDLHEQSNPIDIISVNSLLAANDKLDEIGGPGFLISLVTQTTTSLNAESYASIIRENFVRRRMLSAANELAKMAFAKTVEVENARDLIDGIEEESNKGKSTSFVTGAQAGMEFDDFVSNVITRSKDPHAKRPYTKTFIPKIDRSIGGIDNGSFACIAGRPSMGKTGLLFQVARNNSNHGLTVAYYSLEMKARQLVARAVCGVSGVPWKDVKQGNLNHGQEAALKTSIYEFVEHHDTLYINDKGSVSMADIRRQCEILKPDLICIDYLGLVSGRGDKSYERVSEISRNMKLLAQDLDNVLLSAIQLNRAAEQRADKRPMLSDLRDSGNIEQDLDVGFFVYRDDYYNTEDRGNSNPVSDVELGLLKNRGGNLDMFRLAYDKAKQWME